MCTPRTTRVCVHLLPAGPHNGAAMANQASVSYTLLNRDFQTEVRNADVSLGSCVYGYGNPEQMGLSGPNTTFFASLDNDGLEKWIRLLFGGVETNFRPPPVLAAWKCMAPCILRLLLWFIRVEAINRSTAPINADPRLMTTRCASAVDKERAAQIAADVAQKRAPTFPSDRVRTTVVPIVSSFEPTTVGFGATRDIPYFKGAVLQLLQAKLIPCRERCHPLLCLPALAFLPAARSAVTRIQEAQGWHLLCAQFLYKTVHSSACMLYSAINDPMVYDDTGAVVIDEDASDAHTLRVWARVSTEISKVCPYMEVILRQRVTTLLVHETTLIEAARAALVQFLSAHPAYDALFWEPETAENRSCYGDPLVDRVVSFIVADE